MAKKGFKYGDEEIGEQMPAVEQVDPDVPAELTEEEIDDVAKIFEELEYDPVRELILLAKGDDEITPTRFERFTAARILIRYRYAIKSTKKKKTVKSSKTTHETLLRAVISGDKKAFERAEIERRQTMEEEGE